MLLFQSLLADLPQWASNSVGVYHSFPTLMHFPREPEPKRFFTSSPVVFCSNKREKNQRSNSVTAHHQSSNQYECLWYRNTYIFFNHFKDAPWIAILQYWHITVIWTNNKQRNLKQTNKHAKLWGKYTIQKLTHFTPNKKHWILCRLTPVWFYCKYWCCFRIFTGWCWHRRRNPTWTTAMAFLLRKNVSGLYIMAILTLFIILCRLQHKFL